MNNSSLIAITLTALTMAGPTCADPEGMVQIRKEYHGSATPDHFLFAPLLNTIKELDKTNHDITLRVIQDKMQLDTADSADAMVSQMMAALTALDSEIAKLGYETLCGPDAPRSTEAMYGTLDQLDDLTEIAYHNAYVKFISELAEKQQEALNDWIEERKEGSYYRAASHKSMYEGSPDSDVIAHVEMSCGVRRSKL